MKFKRIFLILPLIIYLVVAQRPSAPPIPRPRKKEEYPDAISPIKCDYKAETKKYGYCAKKRLLRPDNFDYYPALDVYNSYEYDLRAFPFRTLTPKNMKIIKRYRSRLKRCDHYGFLQCLPTNRCACFPSQVFKYDSARKACVYRKNEGSAIKDMKDFIIDVYSTHIVPKATLHYGDECNIEMNRLYEFINRLIRVDKSYGGFHKINLDFRIVEYYLHMAVDFIKSDLAVCNNWKGFSCRLPGICACYDAKFSKYFYDVHREECRVAKHHMCYTEEQTDYIEYHDYGNVSRRCISDHPCLVAKKGITFWEATDEPCRPDKTCICLSCRSLPSLLLMFFGASVTYWLGYI